MPLDIVNNDFSSLQQIEQTLQLKIDNAKEVKKTADKVILVALEIMLCAIAVTAVFFASPIIPFCAVLVLPVIAAFAIAFNATGGQGAAAFPNPSPATSKLGEEIFYGFLKYTAGFGIELGKLIYTAPVAIVAGLTNAVVAGAILPVIACSCGVKLFKNREIAHLQYLLDEVRQLRQDAMRSLPANVIHDLNALGLSL